MLKQINLQDPRLTELEAAALSKILDKYKQYVSQGKNNAAHGAGTAAWILWSTLTDGRKFLTGFGDLNG